MAQIDLAVADVMKACGDFMAAILPGVSVIRTQENQTPMPLGQFVAMTPGSLRRMGTNTHAYHDPGPGMEPGTLAVGTTYELTVQLDVYGKDAQANATMIATLFRDGYAVDQFPAGIAPAYTDDPSQMPMVTGEENWLERWMVKAVMSFTPTTTVPQQFADQLRIGDTGPPVTKDTAFDSLPLPWDGAKSLP